jgi:phospholipase C
MRRLLSLWLAALAATGPVALPVPAYADGVGKTSTPIEHLVVIFQENISFDHYFGTYPVALNPGNEPRFYAAPNTPTVNGLTAALLTVNPNLNSANGAGAANPFRLDRSQAATQDMDHDYTAEQLAFDAGVMDLFPANTGTAGPPPNPPPSTVSTTGAVMGYYDGNTVTALWNYAQHYAMNDNSYGTNFGPSTDGALNLVSGQTNGVVVNNNAGGSVIDAGDGTFTLVSDVDPAGDVCSSSSTAQMGGQNIGDLLNKAGVSWGFFEGGFNLNIVNANGTTGCHRSTTSQVTGTTKADYIPHHQPFQYYASTANPTHVRPTSVNMIGKQSDAANHQYDILDFFAAVKAGNFPGVSFLKAPGYQDGHAGYSDPLDEQTFIVDTINFLQSRPEWSKTAVVILYDDSDGWYDHQIGPIVNSSQTSADALTGTGLCGTATPALAGYNGNPHPQGRCGYGPRQPFLVISPFAKPNFVDHVVTDQSSVIRFVEDNWLSGERIPGSFDAVANSITQMLDFKRFCHEDRLILNDQTGEVVFRQNR